MNRRIFLLMAALFLFSIAGNAQTSPSISIQSVTANGGGCPGGSYSANISPDGQTFSLLLDHYIAESNVQNTLSRMMCEVKVNFRVPPGWTFAVVSADYRGFAYADPSTVVTHQALYSFDGSKPVNERPGFENNGRYSMRAQEFHGPYNSNYTLHQDIDPRIAPWSPCNAVDSQTLFITTFLMARNLSATANAQAQITLDSIDGSVQSQRYQLMWRQCGSGSQKPGRPDNPGKGRPPRFG